MTDFHGKHVWFELTTSDLSAAAAFYARVVGWVPRDGGGPDFACTMVGPADHAVGGMMRGATGSDPTGPGPRWTGYVAVDDVDGAATEVQRLGGRVLAAAQDIAGVGRFAIVADPQGAVLALFRAAATEDREPPPSPAPGTPGHIGWHELHAPRLDIALTFYRALFGWRMREPCEAQSEGIDQSMMSGALGEQDDIGIVVDAPLAQPSQWLYAINMANIEWSIKEIQAGGGTLLGEPYQVQGGRWRARARDPQGAAFAVTGAR